MPRATDLFGGAESLARQLARQIRTRREERHMTPQALAEAAREGDAEVVAALEQRAQLPPKNVLLAYLDALSLSLQQVLPIHAISPEEERRWSAVMAQRNVKLVAGGEGPTDEQIASIESSRWALELFLRAEALDELCAPPPPMSAERRDRSKRVHALIREFRQGAADRAAAEDAPRPRRPE